MNNQYPVDFESLQKGDVFTRADLDEILGKCEEGDMKLRVMNLVARIEEARGFTCKTHSEKHSAKLLSLRILTDAEASRENHKACEQSLQRHYRRLKLGSHVDPASLNDQQQKEHARWQVYHSKLYQAIQAARKKNYKLAAPARNPQLNGGNGQEPEAEPEP
jgi:hypothetical protein